MNIRQNVGTLCGNGTLADWWIAENIKQGCAELDITNEYFPDFKAPPPARQSGELGIAGGMGGRIAEFKRKEMKRAEEKVERLAEINTLKLMISDGEAQPEKKRKISNKTIPPPPSNNIENAENGSAWQEVKLEQEPRNALSTLLDPTMLDDVPKLKLSPKSAKQWILKNRPGLVKKCEGESCQHLLLQKGPGKRNHKAHCVYHKALIKLQGN